MPNTTPAESVLGPITPIRCTEPGCYWACHGVPDKYTGSRAQILADHITSEHTQHPVAEPDPATTLPAALDRVADLHQSYDGACGTCADTDGQAAEWPCETSAALAVARQLLGTTETAPCPTPETHNWGCGCPSDVAAAYASCPGYEMAPSPCRCPCYGCEHNCSAHQPPAAPPTPADRAGLCDRIAAALTAAAHRCDGDCRLSEQACFDAHPINWSAMVGGTTRVEGSVTVIADIALGVLADDAAAGVQPPTSEAHPEGCTCGPHQLARFATPPAAPAAPEEAR
ncbi:hypothetical protein [Streptomyces anulatus]|uniref:hypothetical protein n=1 Tax=Streptomyces anulatus TaxID=1892 RepID=UPI00387013F7|nr:hypothetical protein OG882_05095 [Streptomyces anulatus]